MWLEKVTDWVYSSFHHHILWRSLDRLIDLLSIRAVTISYNWRLLRQVIQILQILVAEAKGDAVGTNLNTTLPEHFVKTRVCSVRYEDSDQSWAREGSSAHILDRLVQHYVAS